VVNIYPNRGLVTGPETQFCDRVSQPVISAYGYETTLPRPDDLAYLRRLLLTGDRVADDRLLGRNGVGWHR